MAPVFVPVRIACFLKRGSATPARQLRSITDSCHARQRPRRVAGNQVGGQHGPVAACASKESSDPADPSVIALCLSACAGACAP